MLHLYDRLTDHGIRIGDTARFPLKLREPGKLYPYTWIVTHFTYDKSKSASVVVKRLADGITKSVTAWFFKRYAIDEHPHNRDRFIRVAEYRKKRLEAGGCDCVVSHPPDLNFYVTCIDGPRKQILLGPYEKHGHALLDVRLAREMAEKIDFRSHFYSFGTASFQKDFIKPGILEQYREKFIAGEKI